MKFVNSKYVKIIYNINIKMSSTNNNSYTAGVLNIDQGYFKNKTASLITSIPSLNLAIMSNVATDKKSDVQINLNSIHLSWNDFSNLFFKSPSGAFYINSANDNVGAISLVNQSYETTYNKNVSFNLSDQIRKAWSKKNNLP